jgi:3'5'-cyclic nucleotide phosphodiesterase
MSVIKLLSRIVAPVDLLENDEDDDRNLSAALHDHTYGITSDPLTQVCAGCGMRAVLLAKVPNLFLLGSQFACAFSALIHDVDHTGVGNPQLIDENPELGERYRNRSVCTVRDDAGSMHERNQSIGSLLLAASHHDVVVD